MTPFTVCNLHPELTSPEEGPDNYLKKGWPVVFGLICAFRAHALIQLWKTSTRVR